MLQRLSQHATRFAAVVGLAAVCAATVVGCEMEQAMNPPAAPEERVTLVDVAPPEQRENGQVVAPVEAISQDDVLDKPKAEKVGPDRYAVTVTRIVFDRPAPKLTFALSTLKPARIDPAIADRWRANGFGLGEIDRSRLALFLANLPDSHGVNRVRHAAPTNDTPVVLIERISGNQRVEFVATDGQTSEFTLTRGKMQFLLRLVADTSKAEGNDEAEGVRLVMVPHHYKAAMSLTPRSPLEKVYDGTVFDDLRINEPVSPGKAWIVWANLPEPTQPEPNVLARPENLDEALATATGDAPTEGEPEVGSEPAPEPVAPERERDIFAPVEPAVMPLAEAMMTGRRARDAAQMILVIQLDRIDR